MAVRRDGKALPWAEPGSQTEDFGGQATSEELTVFLTQLRNLTSVARESGKAMYCWLSV